MLKVFPVYSQILDRILNQDDRCPNEPRYGQDLRCQGHCNSAAGDGVSHGLRHLNAVLGIVGVNAVNFAFGGGDHMGGKEGGRGNEGVVFFKADIV